MSHSRFIIPVILCSVSLAYFAGPSNAGDPTPFTAYAGLEVARDAALSWAADAQLVYLENDETVGPDGTAIRWGYLYYSHNKKYARGYSVRNGEILEAADLGFDFEAPPLPDTWVDSRKALIAAEKKAGQEYRREHGGRLSTMLLIRGALNDKEPNASTWALVYTSDTEPVLVVVVDAAEGKVIKTWRG